LLPRGYTGHQQADEVGVVHMNGRIYDPRLGRFLQADSVIEDIFDPQAINSYSYVRNNPMNATDPTGHWRQAIAIAITIATGLDVRALLAKQTAAAAATAVAHAVIGGGLAGGICSGTLKGALVGALSAFTFHQIGISGLGDTERVFAHALAGGTLEVLGGGKFGHGFISAGLGKALSPLANTGDPVGDGLINAAIGGTISEITGGDFANGAAMAATQYAFNALTAAQRAATLAANKEVERAATARLVAALTADKIPYATQVALEHIDDAGKVSSAVADVVWQKNGVFYFTELKPGMGGSLSHGQKAVYAAIESGQVIIKASAAKLAGLGLSSGGKLAEISSKFVLETPAGSRAARQAGKYLPASAKVFGNAMKVLGSAAFAGATMMIHTESWDAMTRLSNECGFCGSRVESFNSN
jgi:RHS repeat-associated protein